MGFLLLQKIMRNAYYFTVVILLEKHGVSVSEKNLVPSFNVIVFKCIKSNVQYCIHALNLQLVLISFI